MIDSLTLDINIFNIRTSVSGWYLRLYDKDIGAKLTVVIGNDSSYADKLGTNLYNFLCL